ncbi:MAG: transposase [Thermodesulfovibrionales bacterium]
MARPARIEYEGAFYHVMNRGNRREDIFLDDNDRQKFYEILGNIEKRYGIIIYVYVLMSNHYHLLLETPFANLSRAIQRLNGDYALYFSRRHKSPGHIFQGRYKAMLVEKDAYLLELSRYIHLNPLRAGVVRRPEEYRWSSLPVYLNRKIRLPFKLQWEWILSTFGGRRNIAAKKYLEFINEGIEEERDPREEAAGGWILGSNDWVEEVIKRWGNFPSNELSGVKPIKRRVSIDEIERLVCKEFEVGEGDIKNLTYNNTARMASIYLAVNYCGLTLREAGQRYGGISYSAVGKAASRFQDRLAKDPRLNKRIKQILSNIKM